MKRTALLAAVAISFGTAAQSYAQTSGTTASAPAKAQPAKSVEEQIEELRQSMQKQIDELKKQLADRDAQIQVQKPAPPAPEQPAEPKTAAASSSSAGSATQASVAAVAEQVKDLKAEVESPTAFHFKKVTLTPRGFVAAESVWRQRAMDADVMTPFNQTPYMNSGQAHVSEFNGSARQSQVGLLVQGTVPFGKLSGYVEADFFGAGVTSNNNQSNSYAPRLRQAWGQVNRGGFTFTGGQMYSLVTETKKGLTPGTEVVPQLVDAEFHVGYSWTRQYGLRVAQQLTPAVTVGASVEESQIIFSTAGTAAANLPTNFFFGSVAVPVGGYNTTVNYTDNLAPDVLVKVAYDPSFGHFELGGVARFFRDRYYPNSTAVGAENHTEAGGGLVFNAHVPVTKYLDVGVHLLTGEGMGRYGTGLLPDATVKPSGTLMPLRADQGLLSLIAHPTPKLDLLGYAGGEYVQRTFYRNSTGGSVGYGARDANNASCNTESVATGGTGYNPGLGNSTTCTGATRALLQGSMGWTYRLYNGARGKLQYTVVYTYLTREAWAGLAGTSSTAAVAAPKATNNMVFTGFRYYLP
ncbi:MAG TPA: hypothetical protein VGB94_04505 [Acidobacteriaceae bacterium]